MIDAFSLPVEGTETRVNAANEANEYLINHIQSLSEVCDDDGVDAESLQVGRKENAIGWYHRYEYYSTCIMP